MLSPLLSPWPLHQMTFANSDTAIKYAYAVLVPSVNTINNQMLPFACECVYLSNDELIDNAQWSWQSLGDEHDRSIHARRTSTSL